MKHKFLRFRDSLGDLIRSAVQIAVHVLCGYLLSLLVEHTIGERWPDISEIVRQGALVAATTLIAFRFIVLRAVRVYQSFRFIVLRAVRVYHKPIQYSLVDLILETVEIAVFILCTYALSLLVEHTIGERWPDISEIISHVALIAASVLSALQFIALMAVQVYRRLKKELKDEHDRNP